MAIVRLCDKCGSQVTARYNAILNRMDFLCGSCGYEWHGFTFDRPKEDDQAISGFDV